MAAVSETYVDPSIAATSGAGTIGDPYGDIQYALDTMTRDATNGDRINIKAGTDEILAAAIDLTTYGIPGNGKDLLFQGYTSAAGDGGIGGISGNNSVGVYSAGASYVHWRHLHLHNTGSVDIIVMGNTNASVTDCELNNTTGDGISGDAEGLIARNYFHDISGFGANITGNRDIEILANYFANGTKDFTAAITVSGKAHVHRNIISIDGASDGIRDSSQFADMSNNSILSAGGTGTGIEVNSTSNVMSRIHSNLVEGFSGSGGIGILIGSDVIMYTNNAAYNNATAYTITADIKILDLTDNETLSASPFAKSGADTFANRKTYFAPVDTGNVFGGAYQ